MITFKKVGSIILEKGRWLLSLTTQQVAFMLLGRQMQIIWVGGSKLDAICHLLCYVALSEPLYLLPIYVDLTFKAR